MRTLHTIDRWILGKYQRVVNHFQKKPDWFCEQSAIAVVSATIARAVFMDHSTADSIKYVFLVIDGLVGFLMWRLASAGQAHSLMGHGMWRIFWTIPLTLNLLTTGMLVYVLHHLAMLSYSYFSLCTTPPPRRREEKGAKQPPLFGTLMPNPGGAQ